METLQKIHTVKLTMQAARVTSDIVMRQHDYGTNTISAVISDHNDLTEYGGRVYMIFRHGKTVTDEYACSVDGGVITLPVPNSVISLCGFWTAEIHFYEDGELLNRASTSTFSFNVMPDIDPSDSEGAEDEVETLYSRIAEYCEGKLDELSSLRFAITDGRLTLTFSDDTVTDLGVVKGRDAVTAKGTVTLYSDMWDAELNTYTFSIGGITESSTAFFKPHTAADKTVLDNADCFITTSGSSVTVTAAEIPDDDITLEYALIGG